MATVMKRNAAVRERYGPCLITRTKACWKETCFSVLGAYGSETRGIRISSISNNTQQGKADRFAHWNYWNCPCIAVDCACLRGVIYNKEQRMRANVITSMRRSPVYMFLHIPVKVLCYQFLDRFRLNFSCICSFFFILLYWYHATKVQL